MEQEVTITFKATDIAAYLASLDMAIALCEQKVTHAAASAHLEKLRADFMEVYVTQVKQ